MAKVEIIATGNELLSCQVENTTTSFLQNQVLSMGHEITRLVTIGDDKEKIKEVIQEALTRADVVLITGGLGSTPDDLTREALAEAINHPLEFRTELWSKICEFFESRGRQSPPTSIKQAYLPYGATAIPNSVGTAAGIVQPLGNQVIIALPGPPEELREMFLQWVKPFLENHYFSPPAWKNYTLKVFGIGESTVQERLSSILGELESSGVGISFIPTAGEVHLVLRIPENVDDQSVFAELLDKAQQLLGPDLYGVGEETLPGKVGELLQTKGLTVGVAESCTGGLIGSYITDVSGSSAYFLGGVVAYSNDVKKTLLGVGNQTLASKGAVSPETALEMARGIRRLLNSDIGLATTGIAGPTGAVPGKPVGTVYVGLATPSLSAVKKFFFPGLGRLAVKNLAAKSALDFLRRYLINSLEADRIEEKES